MVVAYKINSKLKSLLRSRAQDRGKKSKFIIFIAVVFILLNLTAGVFAASTKYTSFTYWKNFSDLKKVYLDSQYVNKHPKGWIPDEIVNSYAGGEYIKGTNPVLIAADTPPLGRYLIGLSVLIFNNENIVTLVFAALSLWLMYLVGQQIFSNRLVSIIAPLIFSFEPIFKNQIKYSPLLDIFQLVFLLSCFYFFNKAVFKQNGIVNFIFANISLGLFMATKFYITGIVIVAAWILVLVLRKKWVQLKYLLLSLPVSLITMLSSYSMLFAFGYNLKSFLGVQKYIFLYHKSQLILPFSIWPLILFNKWYVWYGSNPISFDSQWLITWPAVTLISISTFVLGVIKKIKLNENILVLIAWVIMYFGFFSFGQITSRYFVILIPVLYIISVYGIFALIKQIIRVK
jgi:hypothetical protein